MEGYPVAIAPGTDSSVHAGDGGFFNRLAGGQASRVIRVRFSDGEERVTTDAVVAAAGANAVCLTAREPAPDTSGPYLG